MIVVHQVNCQGIIESSFAKYVRETYPDCYKAYKIRCSLYRNHNLSRELLGTVQVYHKGIVTVINMFSQYEAGCNGQTDYKAMDTALKKIRLMYPSEEIIAPYKIGCKYAGGDWDVVSKLLEKHNIKVSKNIVFQSPHKVPDCVQEAFLNQTAYCINNNEVYPIEIDTITFINGKLCAGYIDCGDVINCCSEDEHGIEWFLSEEEAEAVLKDEQNG